MMTAPVILAALVIVSCATSIVGSACSACRFCQCETHTLSSRIKTISCVSNDHPLAAHWFEDCGDATLLKLLGTDGDGGSSRVHRHWTRRVFKGREWYATGQQSSWHIQRGVFSHLTALRKLKILQPAFIGSAAFEGLPAQVKVEVAWDYVPLVANPAAAYDPYTGAPYVMADAFDGLAAHVELRFLSTMETRPAVERFLARAWCPPSLRTCTLGEVNIPTGETLREFVPPSEHHPAALRITDVPPVVSDMQSPQGTRAIRNDAAVDEVVPASPVRGHQADDRPDRTADDDFGTSIPEDLVNGPQEGDTSDEPDDRADPTADDDFGTGIPDDRVNGPQEGDTSDEPGDGPSEAHASPSTETTGHDVDAGSAGRDPDIGRPADGRGESASAPGLPGDRGRNPQSGCCTPPPLAVAEAELRRRSRIVTAVGLSIIGSVVLLLSGELVFHYIVRRRFLHSIQPKLGSTIFPVAVATGDRVHTFASTL
ncbi:Uncharacterized protein PBTT_01461 [Plasmodiophora brassicae]|uniref:Uncharacterized protein n=1 Tax=Plasmodiophora brassicae TaxID=37360 RepID=A0A0G4II28_PLABS|nr:hypothetical protein PBRA_003681 [Plasmodiophora brassicae]